MSSESRRRSAFHRTRRVLGVQSVVLVLVASFLAVTPGSPADPAPSLGFAVAAGEDEPNLDDLRAERRQVQRDRAAQAARVDVIEASRDEVLAALDAINEHVHVQEAQLHRAEQALAAAEWAEAAAVVRVAEAQEEIGALRDVLRRDAVESYIQSPTADLATALGSSDPNEAAARRVLVDAELGRRADVLDRLRAREEDLALARVDAANARATASLERIQASSLLDEAEAALAQQLAFEDQVEERLDAALAEAAALSALDKEFGRKIAAGEAEIARRLEEERARAARAAEQARREAERRAEAERQAAADRAQSAPNAATSSASAPTGTSSSGRRTRNTPVGVIERVQGIWVHTTVADSVDAMLDAAARDGIRLGGGGYRDPADQIRLRRAHCGSSDYAIYQMPASRCRPPTARPGRSQHEQGKAVDLTYNGRLITSRNNAAFRWLRDNAATYGFHNLPSEPWHWSVNGR